MSVHSRLAAVVLAFGVLASASGCSAAAEASAGGSEASSIRVGYFDNVTHAPALVGLFDGTMQSALGSTKLVPQLFSAGPATIEALSAGAIDAAYIGPSPAVNSFIKSKGSSIRIVSGVALGGASLVVKQSIDSAADLDGKTLASPQLGNTQDVALRTWLAANGLSSDATGGGDVSISPTDNAAAFTLFSSGAIDGAWLPEPWASRFVLDANAKVLVDEASLWPDHTFPTTVLAVNQTFLDHNPAAVRALVEGNSQAIETITGDPAAAATAINARLTADTGKPLADDVLTRALGNVTFSTDPDAKAFPTLLSNAVAAGLGSKGSLSGLFDLRDLNAIRTTNGTATISDDGLGTKSP